MSDEPVTRDAAGRFPPGVSGNYKGRAKQLPDWFRLRGDDALRHLLAILDGDEEDGYLTRGRAATEIVDRVFGKAPMAPEDHADADAVGKVLAALYAAKP